MTNFTAEQKEYWNSETHLSRRSPDHPTVRRYVLGKLNFIQSVVDLGQNVLDVGAGNGYFSKHLNDIVPTTAVDYSAVMLQENPVHDKRVMDARRLELPDKSYDTVICHAILHHIAAEDRVQVVREMGRVARKNVIIIEPNRNNPLMGIFGLIKKEEHGLLRFTKSYTVGLVEQAGLTIVRACSFGLLTPNRMPIPSGWLQAFERPMPLGIANIVIARP